MEYIFLKRRGFTLLEILIVIAIIGILVSLGVVSYSQAQKKARDSRRRADLKAIQAAFEQYYADSTTVSYPGACTGAGTTYLPAGLPTDPRTGASYAVSCSSTSYCFCAAMESDTGNSGGTCNFGAATTHFCVSQLQ